MLRFRASRGFDPSREKPFSSSCMNTAVDDVPAVSANRCTTIRLTQQSAAYSKPPMLSTMRLSRSEELNRPTPYQRLTGGHCPEGAPCLIGLIGAPRERELRLRLLS